MTVHLARSIKNVDVFCFEPIPNNIEALKRVVRFFKLNNVKIFEFALGNKEGESEMVMPIVNLVRMQGLSHVIHTSITENNEGERFTVLLKKLDNLDSLNSLPKRIGGIKIDVENFEYFVLDGGKNMIKVNQPVVYAELWDNENRKNCFELFAGLNYKTFIISDNKMTPFQSTIHKTQNFIFLPA